jgi:hypothetical protein
VLAGVSDIVFLDQPFFEQGFDGVAINQHRAQGRVESCRTAGCHAGKGHTM